MPKHAVAYHNRTKAYLRQLIEFFPHALVESCRHGGWKGAYLATCAFVLRTVPFSVRLPSLGRIGLLAEAANVVDNFYLEEMRSPTLEKELIADPSPVVVDIGVNVGATVRWWLALNPRGRVIGIDMLEEALAFTRMRLEEDGAQQRFRGVCAAVGETDAEREIWIDEPLEGTSSLSWKTGKYKRTVAIRTLDALLGAEGSILLLKIDIEGYAGRALQAAQRTLACCRHVTIEAHGPEEVQECARNLHCAGFELAYFRGRQMHWQKVISRRRA